MTDRNLKKENNMGMLHRIVVLVVTVLIAGVVAQSQDVPSNAAYKNPKLPVEQRVQDLLGRMTLEEKAGMLSGANWMESVAVPRLGIPSIKMADGPMGIRSWAGPSKITKSSPFNSTAFPAGIAVAATWDPAVAQSVGQAIGQEVKAIGRDMILGPTVNIQRVPLWGRNFEGYGEDPYLAARMGVAYIKGVQGEGVIATVKHFAANNQEFERHRVDESIDERTLQEIYFPAFKAAVQEAGVWSVMSAYQKVNGLYCSENPFLLKDVLRKEWGFKGFVVSDWGSTYSTLGPVNAGMDLEMPGGEPAKSWLMTEGPKKVGNGGDWLSPEKVLPEVAAGRIFVATLDDNVGSILRTMFVSGVFDRSKKAPGEIDTPAQRAVARHGAAESIVLLKNDGNLLPLDPSKVRSLAVIGPNAAVARTGGGGSSLVHPNYAITPLDGIKERAGSSMQVSYALGVSMPGEDHAKDTPEAREELRKEAVAIAAKADAAIVLAGNSATIESEDFDRTTLDLPAGQDELIQAVAKVNRNTVVVFNAGAPVNVSRWVGQVPSVLDAWFGGQEMGHAIADILFGDVNPSGKLPFSFINDFKESPAYGNYPGEDLHVKYAEGIYVGYRYFDKHGIAPQFPFGYGLSYTNFGYSDLKIKPGKAASGQTFEVSLRLRNQGKHAGAEVVQLYVHDGHSSVDRPVKELKGFRRVELAPGKSTTVKFTLDKGSMAYYSTQKKDWIAEPGTFDVLVGASSADIRLKGSFELLP
ncbi:MAG TPA: glycoside hydrolase family 3 C-terminal domain-containing protein [Terriglobales bacterium]|nr:glycoside hydrolase family 3 C-terminal domain-containing protein [Terriglobales bacterium]